jgi:hypothetical protein
MKCEPCLLKSKRAPESPSPESCNKMSRELSAKMLVILLRIFGGSMMLAIVAVIMPDSWLRFAVSEVEPNTPVAVLVEYLARGWSAFYFMLGGLIWLFSTDLPRYAIAGKWVGFCYVVISGGAMAIAGWYAFSYTEWEKPWFFWIVLFNLTCGFTLGSMIFLLYRKLLPDWQAEHSE